MCPGLTGFTVYMQSVTPVIMSHSQYYCQSVTWPDMKDQIFSLNIIEFFLKMGEISTKKYCHPTLLPPTTHPCIRTGSATVLFYTHHTPNAIRFVHTDRLYLRYGVSDNRVAMTLGALSFAIANALRGTTLKAWAFAFASPVETSNRFKRFLHTNV